MVAIFVSYNRVKITITGLCFGPVNISQAPNFGPMFVGWQGFQAHDGNELIKFENLPISILTFFLCLFSINWPPFPVICILFVLWNGKIQRKYSIKFKKRAIMINPSWVDSFWAMPWVACDRFSHTTLPIVQGTSSAHHKNSYKIFK